MVGRQGFEPWKPMAADLQSAPFVHLGTCPFNNSIVRQSLPTSIKLRERVKRGYKTKPNFSCETGKKRAFRVFPFKNSTGRPHQTKHYIYRAGGSQETKYGHWRTLTAPRGAECRAPLKRAGLSATPREVEATLPLVDRLFRESLAWPAWHNRNQDLRCRIRGHSGCVFST